MAAQSGELKADGNQKSGVIYQVALPQTTRLLAEPVGPLESRIFYPPRGVFHVSGVHIKSCAHSDHYLAGKPLEVFGHKPFLLRRAESYPNDIWLRGFQLLFEVTLL